MVYFKLNNIGFNCGIDKTKCPKYPKGCLKCIKEGLKGLSFEFDSNFEAFEIDSIEKRQQMERELIWQKFLDVLNIRHVVIMDKESGLALLNYPVSGEKVDAELLSGFIQANITFSESSKVSNDISRFSTSHQFYEFQYKNFNILLTNGDYVRLCLILDHKASDHMRTQINHFINMYEITYQDTFIKFRDTRAFDLNDMIEYIIDSFNINLVFPMTLAQSIAPSDLETLERNQIQKAIVNLVKELLISKPFFFINNLLNKVKKIVNIEANRILYEIYQLVEKNILLPTKLETAVINIEMIKEANHEKVEKYKPISSIIIADHDLEELREKISDIDSTSAAMLVKDLMKKGKTAEKSAAYQEAEKEYKKALFIARELDLKEDIGRTSYVILELEKKTKQIELEFILKAGENAEKSGDTINSINYYQKALKILESFLIYNISDSRIKKLKKKILKLRSEI